MKIKNQRNFVGKIVITTAIRLARENRFNNHLSLVVSVESGRLLSVCLLDQPNTFVRQSAITACHSFSVGISQEGQMSQSSSTCLPHHDSVSEEKQNRLL